MSAWLTTVCSERRAGHWFDCSWASAVMLANEAYGAIHYPQTLAEIDALRAASGDTGSSNTDDVTRGMAARYKWTAHELTGWTAISSVPVGVALLVQGRYGSLPAHFRRWDANYADGHAVCVVRIESGWWWLDPLATQGYAGEAIDAATLRAFVVGLPGGRALSVTVGARQEDTVVPLPISDTTQALVDVVAGAQFYDLDRVTKMVALTSGGKDVLQLFASGNMRAVRISTGGIVRLALARYDDLTNIRPIVSGADVKHKVVVTIDGTQVYGGSV